MCLAPVTPSSFDLTYYRRSPVTITLSRVPLFYARPNLIRHTSVVSVCLPKKRTFICPLQRIRIRVRGVDILNQVNPSGPKPKTDPGKSTDPGLQSQLEGAKRFVKFVFPRQHGLPNPFVTAENTAPFHDRQIEAAISVCACVREQFGNWLIPEFRPKGQ